MPKSQFTGTQKKALRKETKIKAELAQEAIKDIKRQRPFTREARRDIQAISKGKHLIPSDLSDIVKRFERAGAGAEKIFAPQKEQALREFQTSTIPSIQAAVGNAAGDVSGSSAMRQALAAAGSNLQRGLASDFSTLQANLAQNLLGQSQQAKLQNLNARLQSSGSLIGQPIQPQFGGFQSPYMQKQGGTSGMGGALIGGGLSALGSFAGSEAGSALIASGLGALSSKDVKENIRDYEKGLDVIRDMEVKQYDYTIPVQGRQTDRVGLIAEDMPKEIQAMIGSIKGVDVYGLVALLVNAVKQLDIKVKDLEAKHV